MTLYGESDTQFRPRPTRGRLILFVVGSTILSAWLATLLSSLVAQAAAAVRMVGRSGIPVALYPAGPGDLPGMNAVIDPARLAVAPIVLILLATLMLALWPTSGTLASRLSVTISARILALAALTEALSQSPLQWLSGDLSALGLWRPIIAIASMILIWRSETSFLALLSMFYDVERPAKRTAVWFAASLPQWLVWLLLALVQSHYAGMAAALVAIAVTIIAAAGSRQSGFWERVARPYIVEDTILVTVAAVIVTIAGFATFGAPLLGLERHAVVLASTSLAERVPLHELRVTVSDQPLLGTQRIEPETVDEGETQEDESVIDIRWSKDRPQSSSTDSSEASPTTTGDEAAGEDRRPQP